MHVDTETGGRRDLAGFRVDGFAYEQQSKSGVLREATWSCRERFHVGGLLTIVQFEMFWDDAMQDLAEEFEGEGWEGWLRHSEKMRVQVQV